MFEQFPYNCQVVRQVSKGTTKKVVAARAFFRTNTGNHWVVTADQAREYFSGAAPGERNARWGGCGWAVPDQWLWKGDLARWLPAAAYWQVWCSGGLGQVGEESVMCTSAEQSSHKGAHYRPADFAVCLPTLL